jgi:hypothetical protein
MNHHLKSTRQEKSLSQRAAQYTRQAMSFESLGQLLGSNHRSHFRRLVRQESCHRLAGLSPQKNQH